jgi:hypothetical protein
MRGILTEWVTRIRARKEAAEISRQLQDLRSRLDVMTDALDKGHRPEQELDDAFMVLDRCKLHGAILKPVGAMPDAIVEQVAAVLERHHIGPRTAKLKASAIVTTILASFENDQ